MSGKIHKNKKTGQIYIQWYCKETKKQYKIYRSQNGEKFYDPRNATRTLAKMQGEYELQNGTFDLRSYTQRVSNVVAYLDSWFDTTKSELAPSTAKAYRGYIKNHLKPYFEKTFINLHEIRLHHLTELLKSLKLKSGEVMSGKMKFNILACLHVCLDYAWRDGIIKNIPPFPKKRAYGIQEPVIQWLPEERQLKIYDFIPKEHQPIFQFLRLHARRPGEACAIHKEDYEDGVFTIRRTISDKNLVNFTKTRKEHLVPMLDEFEPFLQQALKVPIVSKYLFVCPTARNAGKRYSSWILNRIWKKACEKAGENIAMYAGTKHSRGCQLINEYGLSLEEVQEVMDHADIRSTRKYAQTEIARKKELMSGKVINITSQTQANKPKTGS